VALSWSEGQVEGLFGRSGLGKSTLLPDAVRDDAIVPLRGQRRPLVLQALAKAGNGAFNDHASSMIESGLLSALGN
jgi:hypothetical protein